MCLYVRPSALTFKSPYSNQCLCYFYVISVHCCPSNISHVFSVLTQLSIEVTWSLKYVVFIFIQLRP